MLLGLIAAQRHKLHTRGNHPNLGSCWKPARGSEAVAILGGSSLFLRGPVVVFRGLFLFVQKGQASNRKTEAIYDYPENDSPAEENYVWNNVTFTNWSKNYEYAKTHCAPGILTHANEARSTICSLETEIQDVPAFGLCLFYWGTRPKL